MPIFSGSRGNNITALRPPDLDGDKLLVVPGSNIHQLGSEATIFNQILELARIETVLRSYRLYFQLWEKDYYIAGVASLVCFTCALFSKEFGVMTLPVFFLYHRFLSEKKKILLEFAYYVPFIIILKNIRWFIYQD